MEDISGNRVTLKDVHDAIHQLRVEVLENLKEERASRRDLSTRISNLELFKAGVEEMLRGEIKRSEEQHDSLERAILATDATLKEFIQATKEEQKQVRAEQTEIREEQRQISSNLFQLDYQVKNLVKTFSIIGGGFIVFVNLIAPIVIDVVTNLF